MSIDVQVIPIKAGHALRVAEIGHPQNQIPREGLAAAEPMRGERQVVHESAPLAIGRPRRVRPSAPRAIPTISPARYVAWCAAKANGTAGKRSGSRRQIGKEKAQVVAA